MEIEDLAKKWLSLNGDNKSAFRSLRIDASCLPDLFIGLDAEQRRCLILKLPGDYTPDFQSSIRQNLSLELYSESRWIVLTLLDEQYFDLFNDLIFSIYNKIKDINNSGTYVSELLKTYYKWSEFFLENSGDGLSDEQIKGLFGELIILNNILRGSDSSNLNDTLNSWKGPYDTGHDFIGEYLNIEVKTKNHSAANIRISSEYQLQAEPGKELELAVVNVEIDPLNGLCLRELILLIREYIIERLGDYTILLKAISQKSLTLKNIGDYNHLKFITTSIIAYDCGHEGFPRIVRSLLPDSISSVNYKLNTNQLQSFIKSEITL